MNNEIVKQKQILRLSPLFFLIAFFLRLCFHVAPAIASPADFEQGKTLFTKGAYLEARKFLEKAFLDDPANPDINFYLGRSAFETGDYETALMAYDRVLIFNPDAARIKLEVARCHLRLGTREIAKQYFREVLATNPPEPVWKNIEKYLAAIEEKEKRHLFTGTLRAGINWDDNVYQSPVYDTILGIELTGPTARPKSDQIFETTAILNHAYLFEDERFSWKTTFTNYNALYESRQDLDVNYFGLNSGPAWKTSQFMWINNMTMKHIAVEHERYLDAFGFATAVTVPAGPIYLNLGARFEEKANYDASLRDAMNSKLYFDPVLIVGCNRILADFFRETENADAKFYGYDRVGWHIRYERQLSEKMTGFASYGLQKTDYKGPDSFFLITRSDTVDEFRAGLSRLLWQSRVAQRNLSAEAVYSHLNSDSTIDLYTYRKTVISLALTLGF